MASGVNYFKQRLNKYHNTLILKYLSIKFWININFEILVKNNLRLLSFCHE